MYAHVEVLTNVLIRVSELVSASHFIKEVSLFPALL